MKKVIICIASIILLCGIGLGFYKFHPHKYNMVDSKEWGYLKWANIKRVSTISTW